MAQRSGTGVGRTSKPWSLLENKKEAAGRETPSLQRYVKKAVLNASCHTLTGRQEAHFPSCGRALPDAVVPPSGHWTAGHSVMDPCRTRCHGKHVFFFAVSGGCKASRVERDKRGPTAWRKFLLVSLYFVRFLPKSPTWQMCVCCAQGSVGKEVLKRGWPSIAGLMTYVAVVPALFRKRNQSPVHPQRHPRCASQKVFQPKRQRTQGVTGHSRNVLSMLC